MNRPKDIMTCENSFTNTETEIARMTSKTNPTDPKDHFQPDLDSFDFCFALASGLVATFLATNEDTAKWLESVHEAASGKAGNYDIIQQMLGSLLFHKGDALDVYASGEGFIGRNGETAYVMFHRLLFGHDILAFGKGIMPHNPFALMCEQNGLTGILQTVRHLLADTMSAQGLPVPGSSYLDCEREGGKPWNKMIDWVQELSLEACGNKKMAQDIYSHMFTIRAQDIAAGGLIAGLNRAYAHARNIGDPIRKAQIELIDTGIAFFGQAAVGTARQKGVPYINNAMIPQLAKAYAGLLAASGKRTLQLDKETTALCASADAQIKRHVGIASSLPSPSSPSYIAGGPHAAASDLIDFLEL